MTAHPGPSRVWAVVVAAPVVAVVAAVAGPVAALVPLVGAVQLVATWRWSPAPRPTRRQGGGRARDRTARAADTARTVGGVARVLVVRVVPAVVGCLVLLVATDWAVGLAWDRVTGEDTPAAAADLASLDLPPAADPRVDHPAMVASPWADRYFAELETLDFTYVPFVGPREAPVRGRYITSAEGIRRSYEPAGAQDDEAITVWFLGGSALWGEGQRDLHTIPSEVARLAEDEGVMLKVVNFGLRGYTAFQEMLVFEQELGRREPPDLAVFYHGFNELSTQTEAPENLGRQPTVFQLDTTTDAFTRAPALPQATTPSEPSVATDYVDTSVVHRWWRAAGSLLAVPPAAAQEPFYVPPPDLMATAVDNAESIYRRTMPVLLELADAHDVVPAIYWQPADEWMPYDELGARVARLGGATDLSAVLDDTEEAVYLDGVHTNELGARLVAEALWEDLGPRVAEVPR